MTPSAYGPEIAALLEPRRIALGPGTPNGAVKAKLTAFTLPGTVRDADMAAACHAGLWLYHDFLDESHAISQDIATPTGSFWHAIMHRREPDAWNSKYWWRRVGAHPVLKQLVAHSPAVGYDYTTPEAFVDFCDRARGSGSADEDTARRVQLLEWQLLFDHCYRAAAVVAVRGGPDNINGRGDAPEGG